MYVSESWCWSRGAAGQGGEPVVLVSSTIEVALIVEGLVACVGWGQGHSAGSGL